MSRWYLNDAMVAIANALTNQGTIKNMSKKDVTVPSSVMENARDSTLKARQENTTSNTIQLGLNQMFTALPQEVSRLNLYMLDCACIYYQRLFGDGDLDPQIGIYRDAEDGPCEACMEEGEARKERMVEDPKIYEYHL